MVFKDEKEGAKVEGIRIAMLYRLMREQITADFPEMKSNWERTLEIEISEEGWKTVWRVGSRAVRSHRFRIFACKSLHKYFYTPQRLARMYALPGHIC